MYIFFPPTMTAETGKKTADSVILTFVNIEEELSWRKDGT